MPLQAPALGPQRSFAKDASSAPTTGGGKKARASKASKAAAQVPTAVADPAGVAAPQSKKTASSKTSKRAREDESATSAETGKDKKVKVGAKGKARKGGATDDAAAAAAAAAAPAPAGAGSGAGAGAGAGASTGVGAPATDKKIKAKKRNVAAASGKPPRSRAKKTTDQDATATSDAPATDGAQQDAQATGAPVSLGGRVRVEDRIAAFKRALLHPYGTLVTSLDCAQAARDLALATEKLSPTMMQRFLSMILTHDREMPKAARAATSRKDVDSTLNKYFDRIQREITPSVFQTLHGVWVSHYKVKGFIPAAALEEPGYVAPPDAEEAFVVYRAARSHGFQPLGLVSEKGTKVDKEDRSNKARTYLVQVDGPRVYVGTAMTMWNQPVSIFCCKSEDTVLFPKKGRGAGSAGPASDSIVTADAGDAAVAAE